MIAPGNGVPGFAVSGWADQVEFGLGLEGRVSFKKGSPSDSFFINIFGRQCPHMSVGHAWCVRTSSEVMVS